MSLDIADTDWTNTEHITHMVHTEHTKNAKFLIKQMNTIQHLSVVRLLESFKHAQNLPTDKTDTNGYYRSRTAKSVNEMGDKHM